MPDYTASLRRLAGALPVIMLLSFGCMPQHEPDASPRRTGARDVHTHANTDQFQVKHIELDLAVDFQSRTLRGSATLAFARTAGANPMVLDTRGLEITKIEISPVTEDYRDTSFELGPEDPILGAPLTIQVPLGSGRVRVHYRTTHRSSALQWLSPPQTAGKKSPFLFTQSQPIHARSWIPLQDTPSVRITYSARIRTPPGLRALMSAGNAPEEALDGDYSFEMPQPVPPYLIALAVGDLQFRPIGARTGVCAEPPILARAAAEFDDTEKMLEVAERLFGTYRWGRYDILVLPPSFPFGGMENPRLTFATPTVLAGDKSLVALVAHELAHSWAGNLVTNATWSDFWLNEGVTVYLERRILEALYGPERAAMEAVLGRRKLEEELARLPPRDQILHVDLNGRDPDDGFTDVPYEKGALLLHTLEAAYGRPQFDAFLRDYFGTFAFQSITTAQFLEHLDYHLIRGRSAKAVVPVRAWAYEPGIPAGAWQPESSAFARVEQQVRPWLEGRAPVSSIRASGWSTHEWLHFLKLLPKDLGAARLGEIDRAFPLTRSGNSEILCQWLVLAVRNQYEAAYPRLREFLISVGRRKYLRPLYEELAKTPQGKQLALEIYSQARPGYHPIAAAAIDAILARR